MNQPKRRRIWCENAVLNGHVATGVTLSIENGYFSAVEANTQPAPGDERLAGLVMAGFANAHSHCFHRVLRAASQANRGSFWTWRELMYDTAQRLDPDNYYELAKRVFSEMAQAGYSCVGEFHYVHHPSQIAASRFNHSRANGTSQAISYHDSNAMSGALSSAARDVGIRITLLDTLYLHGGINPDSAVSEVSALSKESSQHYLPLSDLQQRFSDGDVESWKARVSAFRSRVQSSHVKVAAAIHSIRAATPLQASQAAAFARENDMVIHLHLSEQLAENQATKRVFNTSPTELFHRANVLGDTTTVVHATHLSDNDVKLLADSKTFSCLCPTTERDLGDGLAPTLPLHNAGSPICLGSDSHAVIDPFEEARSIEYHERLRTMVRGAFDTYELLEMAGVNGHRSMGWHDAGRIEVGYRADLVAIELSNTKNEALFDMIKPETSEASSACPQSRSQTSTHAGSCTQPRSSKIAELDLLAHQAVFAANACDVSTVIIDGKTVC